MRQFDVICKVNVLSHEELSPEDKSLVAASKTATNGSYSPYSQFSVGAAIRMNDGSVYTGSNQENISYPCGLCAERTALFYAASEKKETPIAAIAISAKNKDGFLQKPITPCGLCRQALLEYEKKFGNKIKVLLNSENDVYVIESIEALLPLQFDSLD